MREKVADLVKEAIALDIAPALKEAFQKWLDGKDDAAASKAADKIIPLLEGSDNPILQEIYEKRDQLIKKSIQIIVVYPRLVERCRISAL